MQLNLVLAHQFIKKHAFFEASLHPVNRIGHNRYGFLLFLAKIYHLHKTLTFAAGGTFNNFKALDNIKLPSFGIFFQTLTLSAQA